MFFMRAGHRGLSPYLRRSCPATQSLLLNHRVRQSCSTRYIKHRFPGNESSRSCRIPKQNQSFRPQRLQSFTVDHLHFAYPNGKEIIHDLSFEAAPGQIIGVTGPVACGKSTLGKTFLCESPYEGSITFGGKELGKMEKTDRNCIIGYLGHDPELFHGSVEDNIRLGGKQGAEEMIRIVCFEEESKSNGGRHSYPGRNKRCPSLRRPGAAPCPCENVVSQTAGSGSR